MFIPQFKPDWLKGLHDRMSYNEATIQSSEASQLYFTNSRVPVWYKNIQMKAKQEQSNKFVSCTTQ